MEVANFSFLVFLLHHAILSYASEGNSTCGPGLATPGYTYPKGDITLQYGSPLEILCILNSDRKENASSLFFTVDDVTVPQSAVSIYNRTAIRLYIEKPPPTPQTLYYCHLRIQESSRTEKTKYIKDNVKVLKDNTKVAKGVSRIKDTIICLNLVRVGFPPSEVSNFSCVSHNWENMNCSWVPPNNPLETTYELGFFLKPSRKSYFRKSFPCPSQNMLNQHYCVWTTSSDPIYRQPYEFYDFNLTASNKLGRLVQMYTINHYAHVIPNKAGNLTLVEATSDSLAIRWDVPMMLVTLPNGIVNKVMFQSKWDPQTYWEEVYPKLPPKNHSWVYVITGLKYAHTLYDIRVLMRSATASNVDSMWSEPATTTLRTKPTVPGQPPKTDIGSFESTYSSGSKTRDIILYWQQIPRYLENGDTFEYKVTRVEEFIYNDRNITDITPVEITKTYAKYKGLSLNKYRFTIVSSNSEGHSVQESYIDVPSTDQSPLEPASFSKIAFDNGIYELSWNIAPNINSYTIFWCDNKQDRPFDCKGILNWTTVHVKESDKEKCINNFCALYQKNVTLPVDKIYQFALSANMETTSSGMVWASCTVLPEPAKGKLRNVWYNNIGATFIELGWKLECFDRSRIIKGFLITYCPITAPNNSSCKEPAKNITINGGPDISRANVTSLKPYSTYNMYVSAVSDNWAGGIKSDGLQTTTLEAAPDLAPVNLRVTKVTNTSVSLTWSPPPHLNGVLRNYEVRIDDYFHEKVERKLEKVVNATYSGLQSFKEYRFSVYACTVSCSQNFSSVKVKTKVGRPGKMGEPKIRYNATSKSIMVSWDKPNDPKGNIDFYNLKIESQKVKDRGEEPKLVPINGSTTNHQFDAPKCEVYNFQIQAVNIADDNSKLEGAWSDTANSDYCVIGGFADIWWYVIFVGVLAIIAICISMGYFTRCMWLKCKAMQNVGVKLPPQLELNTVYKEKNPADQPMTNHTGSAQLKSLDSNIMPPPDQELLLDKKDKDELNESSIEDNEDVNVDRESSGCGSGHDSVSSSITSGTHITDSGTEADERAPSPVFSPDSPVFSTSSRTRSSDIRPQSMCYSSSGSGVGGGGGGGGGGGVGVGIGGGGEGIIRLAASSSAVPVGYVTVQSAPNGYVSHVPHWPQNTASAGYVTVSALPTPNTKAIMYCKVGLKPGPIKSKDGTFSSSSRDHITDSESGINDDNQFTINPT